MSAYILFSNDHRAQVKEEKPDMKFGEIARELADRWKNATPKDKEVQHNNTSHHTTPPHHSLRSRLYPTPHHPFSPSPLSLLLCV